MDNRNGLHKQEIQIKVELSQKDFVLANLLFMWIAYPYLVGVGIVSLVVGLYALVTSGWHSALFFTFLPAISLIGLVISIVLQSKKENHVYREPKIYSISQEGVYVEFSSSQHQYTWTAIKGIKKMKGYYYLFLGRNEAHVIPEKSFPDRSSLEKFHSFISSVPKQKKRKIFPKIIFFTLVTLIIIGILSNMFSR